MLLFHAQGRKACGGSPPKHTLPPSFPPSTRSLCFCATAQAFLGYALPLLGLYIVEMTERREFAKANGLEVPNLRSCLRLGLPHMGREILRSLLTAAVCFLGF
jgi:hypothetical protein